MSSQFETFEIPDPEVNLGILLAENAMRLAQPDMLAVVRDSLTALVKSSFYFEDEQKDAAMEVAASMRAELPLLRVSAGTAYLDEDLPIGTQRTPTGEIEFNYAVSLNSQYGVDDDPMENDITVGDLLVLDGTEFTRAIGKVLVDAGGGKRFVKAEMGDSPRFLVPAPNGTDMWHPNPTILFPHFIAEQEAELEVMVLATTDAFIDAFGLDPDVLWEKTSGIWWDIKAPGAREMWKRYLGNQDS